MAIGRALKIHRPAPTEAERQASRAAKMEAERLAIGEASRGSSIVAAYGKRYEACTLDNYQTDCGDGSDPQRKLAVERLRAFAGSFSGRQNLVIVGPPGVGKDHLVAAVLKLISPDTSARWVTGPEVAIELRAAMDGKRSEASIIAEYSRASLLAISDIAMVGCGLTDYQLSTWQAILDNRYRHMRPMFATINADDRAAKSDLQQRLTAPILGRLIDGACLIECHGWSSWRKPQR